MTAGVEMTIERTLQHHADGSAYDERQRQRGKERPAELIDQHRADIAAGHGEGAVGEVDEVHQPQRDGEPASQHEQQHAVSDAVEQDGEQRGHQVDLSKTANLKFFVVMAGLVLLESTPFTAVILRCSPSWASL